MDDQSKIRETIIFEHNNAKFAVNQIIIVFKVKLTGVKSTASGAEGDVPTAASYNMIGLELAMNCGPDLHKEPTAGGISKPDREARADHTVYLSSWTGIRLCLLKMWKNNRALVDICGTSHISLMKSSSTVTSIHHFVCK